MIERFETFTVLINRVSRSIRKIKNGEMEEYGLRSAHVSCLYYIYLTNGITATELCDKCEEDKATISRAIEYLEGRGLITRESVGGKKYKSPIYLTEEGTKIGKSIDDKIDYVLAQTSVGLSDEEREEFYRCLTVISNSLDKLAKNYEK